MSKKLTKEYIALKTKNVDIQNLKQLNLWGSELYDVSILQRMPKLEIIISLSLNKLTSLKDFANMSNLRELYVRNNLISEINEVQYLSTCSKLQILWLSENPMCNSKQYRSNVIRLLPNLVKLDDIVISEREKKIYNNNDKEEEDQALIKEEELDQYVDDKYYYKDFEKKCLKYKERGKGELYYDNKENYFNEKSDNYYGDNQGNNRRIDIEIGRRRNRVNHKTTLPSTNNDKEEYYENIKRRKLNTRLKNERSNVSVSPKHQCDNKTKRNDNQYCKKICGLNSKVDKANYSNILNSVLGLIIELNQRDFFILKKEVCYRLKKKR